MERRINAGLDLLGKHVHVKVDRPIGFLHGDIRYPVNYGWVPGMIAGDNEEQDAYILGVDVPISSFDGQVIAVAFRKDDKEDKLVVAPEGTILHQGQVAEAIHFQEQYFDTHVVSIFQKSCGVLPYRVQNNQREYLLVFEEFSKCWSIPKGHMEVGETPLQTAERELLEETGLRAMIHCEHTASLSYPIANWGRKQVIIYLGLVSGTPTAKQGEIVRCQWVKESELGNYLHADTAKACNDLIASYF